DASPDGPEPGVDLPDVVEGGGGHQFQTMPGSRHGLAGLVAMTLVGHLLGHEQLQKPVAAHPGAHGRHLVLTERTCQQHLEESSDEMKWPADRLQTVTPLLLHSTQRIDAGSAARRSGEISLPQVAHVPYRPSSIRSRALSMSSTWARRVSTRPSTSVRSAATAVLSVRLPP